ncbi:MAG: DUF87 domain-containing protein [Candidatus Rokubacteria bacterium]|nr:DUF87 domain-containing protein [Candidatus Rokubacteria bacterium]
MQDFEKLGVFYLGRPYDIAARKPGAGLLLYDAKDLVTHAVCIGMTGSGKTGLCIALLEEALIDGIPALIIDPKGDLANLLLTFPDLRPADFAPWVNPDEARRKGLTVEAYAEQQAALWTKGLAEWGQDGARIRRLREAAAVAIYTPGSQAGIAVSIVRSFAAPAPAVVEDKDLLRERIGTTATSLLGLLGLDTDPLKSREHILVSKILESAWTAGRDLDLATLIREIQHPPVSRIGALDLEAVYPEKERFALATQLNNLLAAPGFDAWLEGEPLDVDAMLHTPEGKPRAAIFSLAHLQDAERMFFVSLLLNETLGWMRAQPGTTTLRAILYMDEIFGYFPPVANPPSKAPLLTLLKQARAYGLGVVLVTQNPVDLDYKGLANTGTWFIGRLQTERDKARVLEGLEGASVGAAGSPTFDRGRMESLLASLGSRVFLLQNVHEDAPEVFESRWAMSYLAGPLTRAQIKRLMDPQKAAASGAAVPAVPTVPRLAASGAARAAARPVVPPGVPQHFIPARGSGPAGAALLYQPFVLGAARLRFVDAKAGVDAGESLVLLAPFAEGAIPVRWDEAVAAGVAVSDLENAPRESAEWEDLPAVASKAKSYGLFKKEFASWLHGSRTLELFRHAGTRETSRPGESERDFRIRLGETLRARREALVAELRKKYAPRTAALEERLRRATQAVAREKEQAAQQGVQTAISVGTTLLGALFGRKAASVANIGRAGTAARGVGRVLKERQDVGRSQETVAAIEQQVADLEAELQAELARVEARADPLAEPLETVSVRPRKTQITVELCALAWAPSWKDAAGQLTPAWS